MSNATISSAKNVSTVLLSISQLVYAILVILAVCSVLSINVYNAPLGSMLIMKGNARFAIKDVRNVIASHPVQSIAKE